MNTLRVMLVDDHDVVRLGLKTLLSRYPRFLVVAEASNAEQAKRYARHYRPDVIVMDARLPGQSGIEATREIKLLYPEIEIIILTSYGDEEFLFNAIRAGASGYILKQIGSQELIRALETVERGDALLDTRLTRTLFTRVREAELEHERLALARLSAQELQVLSLLAKGKTNKDIAHYLHLARGTVRNYVSTLMRKLGVTNRTEAAVFAIHHHIEEHMLEEN